MIHESAGATYTFIGGSWTDKNSWEPATAGNGPGLDDNVVIPEGGNAVMPKSCDIGTLTVRGKLTMGNDLRLNSMTVETGGVFELGADLTCTGMLKNNGQIKGGDVFLKCQNLKIMLSLHCNRKNPDSCCFQHKKSRHIESRPTFDAEIKQFHK